MEVVMDIENLIRPPNALLEQYLDYARSERNLAETTLKAHREYVTVLLEDLRGSPAERWRQMSPSYVLAFFTQQA